MSLTIKPRPNPLPTSNQMLILPKPAQTVPSSAKPINVIKPAITKPVPISGSIKSTATTAVAVDRSSFGKANEATPPATLAPFGTYGTGANADANLVRNVPISKSYITGLIATPPEVGQLAKAGGANVYNPNWQQLVSEAVQRNGGLGDAQNGYLAYSQEYGFVRLKNPNLTDEQNRRFAEISLTMGAPIEKLPSRSEESSFDKPNVNKWADEFIAKYDTKLAAFQANPAGEGMQLKDGRLRFKMEYNQQAGGVVSYSYRKAGPLQTFMQKAMKYVGPVLQAASFIPGVGIAARVALVAAQFAGNTIARGKVLAGDVFNAVSSFVPNIAGSLGFAVTGTQAGAIRGLLGAGAEAIDNKGKFSVGSLISSVVPSLFGGTNPTDLDKAIRSGADVLGKVIDKRNFSASDILGLLKPLQSVLGDQLGLTGSESANAGKADDVTKPGNGLPDWGNRVLESLGITLDKSDVRLIGGLGKVAFDAIRKGKVSAEDLARTLLPQLGLLTDDPSEQSTLGLGLMSLAKSADSGNTDLTAVLGELANQMQANFLKAEYAALYEQEMCRAA